MEKVDLGLSSSRPDVIENLGRPIRDTMVQIQQYYCGYEDVAEDRDVASCSLGYTRKAPIEVDVSVRNTFRTGALASRGLALPG